MSTTSFNYQSLPESYVFPPEERPGDLNFPLAKVIPTIDLGCHDRTEIVRQILLASKEFGVFQVTNHGVPTTLMDKTMSVFKEFHSMPAEEKEIQCSKDPNKSCKFYSSSLSYATEKHHLWRDALLHACSSSDQDYMKFWPDKPSNYREVVAKYAAEVHRLGARILELICEALGLHKGHFNGGLLGQPKILSNHYPRCPDPSLTLGLVKHRDPTVITLIQQDETQGYQVFKDQKWINVELLPRAFLVNIGYLLQVVSNGQLVAVEHRARTSRDARTTIIYFYYPSNDCIVEPAKSLINEFHPLMYRSFSYKDFQAAFISNPGGMDDFSKPAPEDD